MYYRSMGADNDWWTDEQEAVNSLAPADIQAEAKKVKTASPTVTYVPATDAGPAPSGSGSSALWIVAALGVGALVLLKKKSGKSRRKGRR